MPTQNVYWKLTQCPCEGVYATLGIQVSDDGINYSGEVYEPDVDADGSFSLQYSTNYIKIFAIGDGHWPTANCKLVISCATDGVTGFDVRVAYSESQQISMVIAVGSATSFSELSVVAFTVYMS